MMKQEVPNRLVSALQEISSLLHQVDAGFWADKIDQLLIACDYTLTSWDAEKILTWYGSMGSFSDLLISTANGHKVNVKEEKMINERLDVLRETVYEESKLLSRER